MADAQTTALKRGMLEWRPGQIPLRFSDILNKAALPTPPKTFGHIQKYPIGGFGILGNDSVGDCVIAGSCHEEMAWAIATGRPIPPFTAANALEQYFTLTGGDDSGLDPVTTAEWQRATGLTDANGTVHKIQAYASISDPDHLDVAAWLFGACGLGLQLPDSAEDQFRSAEIWNDINSQPADGHYIPYVDRNSAGNAVVITWAMLQAATDAYIRKFFVGGIVKLSPSYVLPSGVSPEAINVGLLNEYLSQFS